MRILALIHLTADQVEAGNVGAWSRGGGGHRLKVPLTGKINVRPTGLF